MTLLRLTTRLRVKRMDKIEAKKFLSKHIARLRQRSYGKLKNLLDLNNLEYSEETGKTGVKYQIKIHAVWDDKKDGDLRVLAEIDDGGWRAFFPLSEDFIISPNGKFVGE